MQDRTRTSIWRCRTSRGLLGASCLAMATALAAAPTAEAQDKNVVTYGFYDAVDVYGEPLRGSTYDEHRVHLAQFEPQVYDFNGRTGERGIRPGLATSWEAIDETTWRFNLREGVTFHNGAPFNAEAVKYSIERVFRDDFPGADKFLEVPITSVEIIDDYTVDIITSEPVPIMPERLSRNGAYIVEPGHYESIDYDEALTSPMGTGPFRMVEFIPDELIRLEAYEDYWGWDELSNVDELRFKIIPELSTAVAELVTGEVDMVRLPGRSRHPHRTLDGPGARGPRLHLVGGREHARDRHVRDQRPADPQLDPLVPPGVRGPLRRADGDRRRRAARRDQPADAGDPVRGSPGRLPRPAPDHHGRHRPDPGLHAPPGDDRRRLARHLRRRDRDQLTNQDSPAGQRVRRARPNWESVRCSTS
jgi:hypothetical protein